MANSQRVCDESRERDDEGESDEVGTEPKGAGFRVEGAEVEWRIA